MGTGTTPDNGQLTFKDLPIYDADGKEITYYIRETKAPDGYYGTTTELSTTLIPGEIVSTVNGQKDGDKLTLVNNRYQTFTVSKVYYNVWEHAFTGEEIPLEGAYIRTILSEAHQLRTRPRTVKRYVRLFPKLSSST